MSSLHSLRQFTAIRLYGSNHDPGKHLHSFKGAKHKLHQLLHTCLHHIYTRNCRHKLVAPPSAHRILKAFRTKVRYGIIIDAVCVCAQRMQNHICTLLSRRIYMSCIMRDGDASCVKVQIRKHTLNVYMAEMFYSFTPFLEIVMFHQIGWNGVMGLGVFVRRITYYRATHYIYAMWR